MNANQLRSSKKTSQFYPMMAGFLLIYFIARLIFLASTTTLGVPPDELTHYNKAIIFSQTWAIPADGPETYKFGIIATRPVMAHYVLGRVYWLGEKINFLGFKDYVWLRLSQIFLALIFLYYLDKLVSLISQGDSLTRLFALIIATNIPMLSVLWAAVSYDNLVNVLAAYSFFYLLKYLDDKQLTNAMHVIAASLLGCLCKITYAPLAAMMFIVVGIKMLANYKLTFSMLKSPWQTKSNIVLVSIISLLVMGNLWLYGGNLLKYKTITPSAASVVGFDHMQENRIALQFYILDQYHNDEVTFEQANKMVKHISKEGDRNDTYYMLARQKEIKLGHFKFMPFHRYLYRWMRIMVVSVVGVAAHVRVLKSTNVNCFAICLLMVIELFVLINLFYDKKWPRLLSLLLIPFFYALVLLFYVNYPIFQKYGVPAYATQGRYLFLTITPLIALAVYSLNQIIPKKYQAVMIALFTVLLVYSDFFYLLFNAPVKYFSF